MGGTVSARTCYFEDLLWDVKQQKFVFYAQNYTQPYIMTDRLLGGEQFEPTGPYFGEPWIKLRRWVQILISPGPDMAPGCALTFFWPMLPLPVSHNPHVAHGLGFCSSDLLEVAVELLPFHTRFRACGLTWSDVAVV